MRKTVNTAALVLLAGTLTAGMLTGCGKEEKPLDGTAVAATVNGTDIPMGIVSLTARQQQAYTESMYLSFMGSLGTVWDQAESDGSDETYGEHMVHEIVDQVELMYLMREKAPDYGVEVTEEDQAAIEEAAKAFMEDNDEETLKTLAVTEDQVKEFLELNTYEQRMHDPIVADVDREVSDEEAQQSAFTYVSFSIDDEELTEDDVETKREQAQQLLDQMLEDPSADMEEAADAIDDTLNALTGTFTAAAPEDETEDDSIYPLDVVNALRETEEGEMVPEIVETDGHLYVLRLDARVDEDATQSKRDSIISDRENELYTETTEQWVEEADITENDKVIETLKVTDSHHFSLKPAAADETAGDEVTEEEIPEELPSEDAADTEDAEEDMELEDVTSEDVDDITDAEEEDADSAPEEETEEEPSEE